MPINDGFGPDHPLPLFLVDGNDEAEQRGSFRIFKTALLVLTASAIGAAVLTFGAPLTRLAAVTASLVDVSTPQPDNRQPAPTIQSAAEIPAPPAIQSTADVQAPPAAGPSVSMPQEARQEIRQEARQEVAVAAEPADRPQTQTGEASEALFRQFEAWSRDQDSRQAAQAASAQGAPAKVEPDARAPVRTAKKHRRVRAVQNARAELQSVRTTRARVLRERSAPAQTRPIEEARAQPAPVQNPPPSQPPSLSQIFGWQ